MIEMTVQEIELVSGGVNLPGYPSSDWTDPLADPLHPDVFNIN